MDLRNGLPAQGRHTLVNPIFARTDVLGFQRLEYELTEDAIELGLDAALPSVIELIEDAIGLGLGAALPGVLELGRQIGEFGRGERRQTTLRHLNVPASLRLEIEVTGTERWLTRSTA